VGFLGGFFFWCFVFFFIVVFLGLGFCGVFVWGGFLVVVWVFSSWGVFVCFERWVIESLVCFLSVTFWFGDLGVQGWGWGLVWYSSRFGRSSPPCGERA